MIREIILVGAGHAGQSYWIPALQKSPNWDLTHIVDPDPVAQARASAMAPGVSVVGSPMLIAQLHDATVMIVTNDHLPVLRDYYNAGCRRFIIEKPIVSRDADIPEFEAFLARSDTQIYSIDHYYQKLWPLKLVLGVMSTSDPRVFLLSVPAGASVHSLPNSLGDIQSVSIVNIEGGGQGIPYLDAHPWVEHDRELGGTIRDLGPHVLAPLIGAKLLSSSAHILSVQLDRLSNMRTNLAPVMTEGEIETHVHALLKYEGAGIDVTFGKVPLAHSHKSLVVIGSLGTFYGSIARGGTSTIVTKKGKRIAVQLTKEENDLVLLEAALFFNDQLPVEFDGNVGASMAALKLGVRLRDGYFLNKRFDLAADG